jgi:hypothetical protein
LQSLTGNLLFSRKANISLIKNGLPIIPVQLFPDSSGGGGKPANYRPSLGRLDTEPAQRHGRNMEDKKVEQKIISSELEIILNQLSWRHFKEIIQDVGDLGKLASVKSLRVHEKNRRFFLPVLKKKCLGDGEILHYVFSSWFNQQKRYYDCLKPFFQSEGHSELLKERGVDSSKYVINDDYFGEFLEVIRLADIDKFLLLSPVCFTAAQKEQLEHLRNKP